MLYARGSGNYDADMEYARIPQLPDLLRRKSFFLFGPRATGKSWLARHQLGDRAVLVDLLRGDVFLRLSANPSELEGLVDAGLRRGRRWVVIDEIQRLPELLNEVHRLIEERALRFLLTGSSARKLRRGGTNLLAGRAWTAELHPLTSREIQDFDLERYLRFGGLPAVQLAREPEEELAAYVHTYLTEEIKAEGLVRKLPPFSRFLAGAALSNGRTLSFAGLAGDAGVPASTIRQYYGVLEDTLLGFFLQPWRRSRTRKAVATAKFYFFDVGVTHALCGTRSLDRNSDLYGRAFEHWVAVELRAFLSYRRLRQPLGFWRSTHGHEVDFVVGERLAVGAKASRRVGAGDLRGLRALQDEGVFRELVLVSQDPVESMRDGIRCLHWKTFLDELWAGRLTG
jgi:predicted AAA+ superfamily ATPase